MIRKRWKKGEIHQISDSNSKEVTTSAEMKKMRDGHYLNESNKNKDYETQHLREYSIIKTL